MNVSNGVDCWRPMLIKLWWSKNGVSATKRQDLPLLLWYGIAQSIVQRIATQLVLQLTMWSVVPWSSYMRFKGYGHSSWNGNPYNGYIRPYGTQVHNLLMTIARMRTVYDLTLNHGTLHLTKPRKLFWMTSTIRALEEDFSLEKHWYFAFKRFLLEIIPWCASPWNWHGKTSFGNRHPKMQQPPPLKLRMIQTYSN